MNKLSIKVSNLLNEKVIAGDVLKIHRSINNFNLASNDVINIENRLLINSWKNSFLFNSEYLYYKMANVLKDMGIYLEQSQLEETFNILLYKSKNVIENRSLSDIQKVNTLNEIFLNNFYINIIKEEVIINDISKICRNVKNNNQAYKDIINLESDILLDPPTNRLAYYKFAMTIKGIGTNIGNVNIANNVFDRLLNITNLILNIPYLDDYTKINILDFTYFKYGQLNFKITHKGCLEEQLDSINKDVQILLKNIPNKNVNNKKAHKKEKEKEKVLVCQSKPVSCTQ